jgi:hypothetical protein
LAHKLARAVYYMLHRGQAFEARKFFRLTLRAGQPARPELDGGSREDGHDAARPGPPRHDLEGGRYLDPPEIKRRASRRRVHAGEGMTTPPAAGRTEER